MIQNYEMDGDAAGPGEIVQLTYKLPNDKRAIFKGLTLGDGCEAVKVIIGKDHLLPDEAIGKLVPMGSYIIAMAQNPTEEVLSVRGVVTLEGDDLPSPNPLGIQPLNVVAPAAAPEAPPTVPEKPAPLQPDGGTIHGAPTQVPGFAKQAPAAFLKVEPRTDRMVKPTDVQPQAIRPGQNEVGLCLLRADVQSLYQALLKQDIRELHPGQIGTLMKRLDDALKVTT